MEAEEEEEEEMRFLLLLLSWGNLPEAIGIWAAEGVVAVVEAVSGEARITEAITVSKEASVSGVAIGPINPITIVVDTEEEEVAEEVIGDKFEELVERFGGSDRIRGKIFFSPANAITIPRSGAMLGLGIIIH